MATSVGPTENRGLVRRGWLHIRGGASKGTRCVFSVACIVFLVSFAPVSQANCATRGLQRLPCVCKCQLFRQLMRVFMLVHYADVCLWMSVVFECEVCFGTFLAKSWAFDRWLTCEMSRRCAVTTTFASCGADVVTWKMNSAELVAANCLLN